MSKNEEVETDENLEEESTDTKIEFQSGIKELAKRLSGEKKASDGRIEALDAENRALKEEIRARDDELKDMAKEHVVELENLKEQMETEKNAAAVQVKELEEELNAQKVDAVRRESEVREEYEDKINSLEKERDVKSGELSALREHASADNDEWARKLEEMKTAAGRAEQTFNERAKQQKEKALEVEDKLSELKKSSSIALAELKKELAVKDKETQALKVEVTQIQTAQAGTLKRHAREIEKIKVSAANQALKELEKKLFEEQSALENAE